MEYDFKEILDIGLEIEFSNLRRDTNNFLETLRKKSREFRVVHDASSETPELSIANIPIQFDIAGKSNKLLSIVRGKGFETFGGELNSPIMPYNDFKTHVYSIIDFLRNMGETFSTTEQDNRGSIHVHINVSKDIKHKHLIRLLELGLATESIFYRLGGMGSINRGVKNNFIYQRPLTMPPCIEYSGKYYPIFDYRDLLESKNKTDFYTKYGDTINCIHNGSHYVTQRYTGLNFYSIPYRGSIEFRYANKVLIPEWIIAWVLLCQSFVAYALSNDKDNSFENEYRKLEDNRNIPEEEFIFIIDKLNIPDDYKATLFDMWRESTIPQFDGIHRLTHLKEYTFFSRDANYYPKPIDKAVKSNVKDVRNIMDDKQNKLSNINEKIEVDYIVNNYGIRGKLKDLEENMFMDNMFGELDERTVSNYAKEDFNIEDYNEEEAYNFIMIKFAKGKFIPFRVLNTGEWHEFNTLYGQYNIEINIVPGYRKVKYKIYDLESDKFSKEMDCPAEYNQYYKSYGVDFSNVLSLCDNHPDLFFPEDENNNDDNDIFGEFDNLDNGEGEHV